MFTFWGGKFLAKQFVCIFLNHDFCFEIQPRGEAEVFVKWPGIAVNAAMFTAPIGVDAGLETHVRAVIVSNNCAGFVLEKLSAGKRVLFWVPVGIAFQMNFFKTVGRIASGATSGRRIASH